MKWPVQFFHLILILVTTQYDRDIRAQSIHKWQENFFHSASGTTRRLSAASKKKILTINTPATSVSFSHDWTILALSQYDDDYIALLDLEALEADTIVCPPGSDVEFFMLLDLEADTIVTFLSGHEEGVSAVQFSPVAMLLASGSVEGTVKLRDVETHTNIASFTGRTDEVYNMSFSDDGRLLASGSWEGIVRVWDIKTHEKIATLGGHDSAILEGWLAGYFTPVSFSPGGRLLAFGTGYNITVWNIAKQETIATIEDLEGVISAEFSPDGKLLASRTATAIKMWDVATKGIRLFEADEDNVTPAVFSPDGTMLASTLLASTPLDITGDSGGDSYGSYIVLWNTETGERIASWLVHSDDGVRGLTFSPDGTRLATHSFDGTVTLWEIAAYIAPQSPIPDFDGDGTVGFGDFVLFAAKFGLSHGAEGYDARYDLDGNGAIGFSDFLIFASAFGNNTTSG